MFFTASLLPLLGACYLFTREAERRRHWLMVRHHGCLRPPVPKLLHAPCRLAPGARPIPAPGGPKQHPVAPGRGSELRETPWQVTEEDSRISAGSFIFVVAALLMMESRRYKI